MPLVILAYVLELIRGSGDNNSNTFSIWILEIFSLLRLCIFNCTLFQCVRRNLYSYLVFYVFFFKFSTWYGLNQNCFIQDSVELWICYIGQLSLALCQIFF
jgi:hypothetical protein